MHMKSRLAIQIDYSYLIFVLLRSKGTNELIVNNLTTASVAISDRMSVFTMPKRGYVCAQLQISHLRLQV